VKRRENGPRSTKQTLKPFEIFMILRRPTGRVRAERMGGREASAELWASLRRRRGCQGREEGGEVDEVEDDRRGRGEVDEVEDDRRGREPSR
jgi:hypothetical protein